MVKQAEKVLESVSQTDKVYSSPLGNQTGAVQSLVNDVVSEVSAMFGLPRKLNIVANSESVRAKYHGLKDIVDNTYEHYIGGDIFSTSNPYKVVEQIIDATIRLSFNPIEVENRAQVGLPDKATLTRNPSSSGWDKRRGKRYKNLIEAPEYGFPKWFIVVEKTSNHWEFQHTLAFIQWVDNLIAPYRNVIRFELSQEPEPATKATTPSRVWATCTGKGCERRHGMTIAEGKEYKVDIFHGHKLPDGKIDFKSMKLDADNQAIVDQANK